MIEQVRKEGSGSGAGEIQTRGVDPLPLWKTGWRKFRTFLRVSQKKRKDSLSQQEFIATVSQIQGDAAKARDLSERSSALWKMESLGFSLVRYAEPGNTLNDPQLPIEARPITHVGMGAGAVEVGKFDPAKITEAIESYSDPDYRLFPYESLGAMLAMHEPRRFALDRFLLRLEPLSPPPPEEFLNSFPPEVQRLICHGYGRILYFRNTDIGSALRAALRTPFLQLPATTQGIAFAYMMVNNRDLYRLLEVGDELGNPEVSRAFVGGMVYALEFWEWVSPGFLKTLQPHSDRQSELVTKAQDEIHQSLARKSLPPFEVG